MKRMASENGKSKSSSARTKRAVRRSYAMCIDNDGYLASLEFGKVYLSLPTRGAGPEGWLRIIDESGEDYLYDGARFVPVELPPKGKSAFAARSMTVSHPVEVVG